MIHHPSEDLAGHRTKEPHDCFTMNCADLGEEVAALQERLAAARGEPAIDVERLAARVLHWEHEGTIDVCSRCSHRAHLFAEVYP